MLPALRAEDLLREQVFNVNGPEPQRQRHQARCGFCLAANVVFAAVVALAGCSFSPRVGTTDVSCGIIAGQAFLGLFKQPPQDLALYLEDVFHTNVEEVSQPITTTSGVAQESYYNWSSEIGVYELSALNLTPRYVYLTFADEKPALGRVIECLGAPTHYSMRYGSAGDSRPFVIGELFYADKGVIVRFQVWNSEIQTTSSRQNPVRAVNHSTPVDRMQWVEPGHDIETMDWLAALYEWRPDETSRLAYTQQKYDYYRSFRLWPGAIDRMELTYVAPYLLPASTIQSPIQPTSAP